MFVADRFLFVLFLGLNVIATAIILTMRPEKIYRDSFPFPYEPRHEKTCLREFPTKSDSYWPAQLQKLAWCLKFWLQNLETLHYLGSEQQRR